MAHRINTLVLVIVVAAAGCLLYACALPSRDWTHFCVYLFAVLLCSELKVPMPKCNGTMSVSYPFILLSVIQLSPLQAAFLAAGGTLAQCLFHVTHRFTLRQIVFNVANVSTATVLAWFAYRTSLSQLNNEGVPALAVAATVFFLANTLPVALAIGWESGASPYKLWRREFLWYHPFYLAGAVLAVTANFVSIAVGWLTSLMLFPVIYTIYRGYRSQMALVQDRERHIDETRALHLRTIEGLAMAIEAKDQTTHQHLMRVRVYASELGRMLGLDESSMEALLTAALLHDIGKLAIPEHIINKPGKLTREEFEKMKIHPVVGANILARVNFPYPVVPIVRSHHEAWDGSGYPDGLKGKEIPIGARILTIVDCFDALASDRPYRRAMPPDQVIEFIKNKAGKQFDPEIVKLLEKQYQHLEQLAGQEIVEMQPLNTALLIDRGAAPGNGFEPTHNAQAYSAGDSRPGAPGISGPAKPHYESLELIAAASQEARAIFEFSQTLGTSLGVRETISMMSRRLETLIESDCLAVFFKSGNSLQCQYCDGGHARAFTLQPIPLGEGLSGWVALNGRPILNGNPTVEPNYRASSGLFKSDSSALAVPLFDLAGTVFAVLTIYSRNPAAFSKDHLRILQAIQTKFALSLQNALRFRTAEPDTNTDHLTKLSNIRSLIEQIEGEIEKSRDARQKFAVVVCDLNSFKAVNDRYGHSRGNELLRLIAEEFRTCCSAEDTLARTGGDEFAFLFRSLQHLSVESRLATLDPAVQRACIRLQIDVDISCSAGFAVYPEDGLTAEELLGKADRRMYRHKHSFYDMDTISGLNSVFQNSIPA
jgi:diguanylate cyclase (GGDEF)-like protein/putative nucleotidyltransferase with HDIG domain